MKIWYLLLKQEMKLLSMSREGLVSVFFFAFLVLFLLSLVLKKSSSATHDLAYQSLVLSVLLSSLFRLQRSFEEEAKSGILSALTLAGVSPLQIMMAKAVVNMMVLSMLALFSLVLAVIFFNVANPTLLLKISAPLLILGTLGLAWIGTFLAGISAQHEKRELLLTILLFPLLLPLVIAVINAPNYDFAGMMVGVQTVWIKVLLGFNLIFGIILWMLSDVWMEGMNEK